jgi:hypothetical protein
MMWSKKNNKFRKRAARGSPGLETVLWIEEYPGEK